MKKKSQNNRTVYNIFLREFILYFISDQVIDWINGFIIINSIYKMRLTNFGNFSGDLIQLSLV